MTAHGVHVVTDARTARTRRRQMAADVWTAVKVATLVVASLAAAPLELVAARLGLPPVGWTARKVAAKTRADWRARTSKRTGGGAGPAHTDQDETEVPELSGVVIPKEAANRG